MCAYTTYLVTLPEQCGKFFDDANNIVVQRSLGRSSIGVFEIHFQIGDRYLGFFIQSAEKILHLPKSNTRTEKIKSIHDFFLSTLLLAIIFRKCPKINDIAKIVD